MSGEIYIYRITPEVMVCGATLAQISFPDDASVVLIVRDDEPLPARGQTRLMEGDFVYVFCKHEDEPRVGLLFGPAVDE